MADDFNIQDQPAASDLTNVSGTLAVANGGTGFTGYGTHAIVRTPASGAEQAIPDNTWTQIEILTNEIADAGGLWDGANSESTVLAAGVLPWTLTLVADTAVWELAVYNDGVFQRYHGKSSEQQPNWGGMISADGTSIYSFWVRQVSGGPLNIYKSTDWAGLFLFKLT